MIPKNGDQQGILLRNTTAEFCHQILKAGIGLGPLNAIHQDVRAARNIRGSRKGVISINPLLPIGLLLCLLAPQNAFTDTSAPVNVPIQITNPGTGGPILSMIITPSSTSVLDNSSANTVLATISVTMASGDPFVGTFSSSNPIVGFSGSDIVLARDLTPSDVAALNITITATTAPPVPTSISVTPSSVNEPDNAVSGTIVATIAVTMSDGSSYAGTPTSSNPGIFGISGMNVVLARDLVAGDDGFYNVTISP